MSWFKDNDLKEHEYEGGWQVFKFDPKTANLSESIDTPGSVCETAHKEENRCCACGCFMEGFDCSTEAAEDYDFKCNNKKCPSNNRLK